MYTFILRSIISTSSSVDSEVMFLYDINSVQHYSVIMDRKWLCSWLDEYMHDTTYTISSLS